MAQLSSPQLQSQGRPAASPEGLYLCCNFCTRLNNVLPKIHVHSEPVNVILLEKVSLQM